LSRQVPIRASRNIFIKGPIKGSAKARNPPGGSRFDVVVTIFPDLSYPPLNQAGLVGIVAALFTQKRAGSIFFSCDQVEGPTVLQNNRSQGDDLLLQCLLGVCHPLWDSLWYK
jgi:hypothetical protein